MKPQTSADLFSFMTEQINFTAQKNVMKEPQAFARWFLEMYFQKPHDIFISDGSSDGKIDAFFKTNDGHTVRHHVLNCKYTHEFQKLAPVQFYDETCELLKRHGVNLASPSFWKPTTTHGWSVKQTGARS